MYILPAIDLKNGEVVRLVEGDYDNKTTYFKDPLEVLDFFIESGSSYLHVVDLDGASDGETINFKTIEKIIKKCDLFVEVGGGIRNEETIKKYLDIGVKRTILGTAAVENIDFTNNMINKYKDHIAVSIDSRDRMIAVKIIMTILLVIFMIGKMSDSFNNKENAKLEIVYFVEIVLSIICTIILFRL